MLMLSEYITMANYPEELGRMLRGIGGGERGINSQIFRKLSKARKFW